MAIAFVDTAAHRAALDWYSAGRSEPGGTARALSVTRAVGIANMTLEALLDAILANAARGDDVIVVGHGREGGLSMRLVAGSEGRARGELVRQLASDRPTRDDLLGNVPAVSDAQAAAVCQLSEAQVRNLRSKMNRVRALTLTHVALRACKLGAWPDVLRAYLPFFGCRIVSAPDLRDTYGTIRPGNPPPDMGRWIAQNGRGRHLFTYGSAPNRVAVATRGGQTDDHTYQLEFAYETPQALRTWSTQYLGAPASGPFPYHGQWRTYAAPSEPQIVFVGDPEYNAHVVVVAG